MSFLHLAGRIHAEGFTPQPIDPLPDQDRTAFLKSCKSGNLEAVKAFCEQHPGSVNVQDAHGKSGLMLAAGSGAFKTVEYLSNVPGYVVGMEDENWENALFDAARANSAKIVALLIHKKIPIIINKNGKHAGETLKTQTPSKEMFEHICKAIVAQGNRDAAVILKTLERGWKNPSDREKYIAEAEEILGRKLEGEFTPNMRMAGPEGYAIPDDADLFTKISLLAKIDHKEQTKLIAKSSAEDPVTQRKVVEFFRAHPPASIKEARKTVSERFGIRPTLESLEKLLKWGKIEFKKSEPTNAASEVD